MNCKCCFFEQTKKYLIKCKYCKNNLNKEHKWYEFHILLIRNNATNRLLLELFILINSIMWFIFAYFQYFKIIDYNSNKFIDWIIKIFLIIYVIILLIYLDGLNKLNTDIYYQL